MDYVISADIGTQSTKTLCVFSLFDGSVIPVDTAMRALQQ